MLEMHENIAQAQHTWQNYDGATADNIGIYFHKENKHNIGSSTQAYAPVY